jgi:hypothetical protein
MTVLYSFLSVSIDPVKRHGCPLRAYAGNGFNASHDGWWFVTGDKKKFMVLL